VDQSRFIRGLLDDPRDPQLPQYEPQNDFAPRAYGLLNELFPDPNVMVGDAVRQYRGGDAIGAFETMFGAMPTTGALKVGKRVEAAAKRASDLQELSSAGTSVRQVPGLFNNPLVELQPGYRNIDIGGGRFDDGTEFLRARGVDSSVYDPFNRPAEHNQKVMDAIRTTPADMATVANVLNVIKEPEARKAVIQQAFDAIRPGGNAYFSVYGGDRSGVGAVTPKGWQENRLPPTYADEIASVFGDTVTRKGNVFKATRSQDSTTTGLLGARD